MALRCCEYQIDEDMNRCTTTNEDKETTKTPNEIELVVSINVCDIEMV